MWLTLLARYWKPLIALVLCVAALSWAYSKGRDAGQAKCDRENAKQLVRLTQRIAEEQARNAEIDALLQKALTQPKAGVKIREVVRKNPSECVVSQPVAAGLRETIRSANAATR